MTEEVLISVGASQGRRVLAVGSLGTLGSFVAWIALAGQAPAGITLLLLVTAAAAMWAAWVLWRVTEHRLELTRSGLYSTDGTTLATVDAVAKVDRGTFAFKPSGGFLVHLNRPAPRAWAPGLWWRAGRTLGVGGVLPGGQARAMAELLQALRDDALP